MADACCEGSAKELRARHRSVLRAVLLLNLAFFGIEGASGVVLGSSALLGDSLDMLGDALVYAASLWVVGRSEQAQARVALGKGLVMAVLGGIVVADALSTALGGELPPSVPVGAVGLLALAGNTTCFALLYRVRGDNLNLRSTWLCSRNDLVANVAVIASAGAVALTASPWPDALVGAALAALWLRTSVRVLREAWPLARPAIAHAADGAR
jgi:Co/Zn/Cd efflux system component